MCKSDSVCTHTRNNFMQILMNVPFPMEDVSITVLIQMAATIVHVKIALVIHSTRMDTIV